MSLNNTEFKNTQNSSFCECAIVTVATDEWFPEPRDEEEIGCRGVGTNLVMMEILNIRILIVDT